MPDTATKDEAALKEALYATNRAIDALISIAAIVESTDEGDSLADNGFVRLTAIRDEIWTLGTDLYNWKD